MSREKLKRFEGQKYLTLESYRKTGAGVATPVWFAEDGGRFYIYSLANAGKVKRIRNNPRVRVAPCDIRGNRTGEWEEGTARILLDAAEAERAHRLLDRKYGWMKRIGNLYSKLVKRERAAIAISLE
ncbi:MAG TPA: PPOX class F420-dependent oxidoreductase [Blastocatellia bacterium]|nr:PPOX class F420-dependent oxidoreductase [Blastocatellia bacterium]